MSFTSNGTRATRQNESTAKLCPTLVIGLGGCGSSVLRDLRRICHTQAEESGVQLMVKYLIIDTDYENCQSLMNGDDSAGVFSASEVLLASVSNVAAVTKFFDPHENWLHNRQSVSGIMSWWPEELDVLKVIHGGTSNIRPYGRLAFFANYKAIRQSLKATLDILNDEEELAQTVIEHGGCLADFDLSAVKIILVCSSGGGTGGGMLIDVAFLVRELAPNVVVSAHLAFPDHYVSEVCTSPDDGADRGRTLERLRANSYALLKELNHYQSEGTVFEAYWDMCSHVLPAPCADFAYIYDGINANGTKSRGGPCLHETLAKGLFIDFSNGLFMASRVTNEEDSTDPAQCDTPQGISYIKRRKSGRYMACGLHALVIPHAWMQDYCTTRLTLELVQLWTAADNPLFVNEDCDRVCRHGLHLMGLLNDPDNIRICSGLINALDNPAGQSTSLENSAYILESILATGREAAARVLAKSRLSGAENTHDYVSKIVDELHGSVANPSDNVADWGTLAKLVRASADLFIERAIGVHSGHLAVWAAQLLAEGRSCAQVVRVLTQLASMLGDMQEAHQEQAGELSERCKRYNSNYVKGMAELEAMYSRIFVINRRRKQMELATKCLNDAAGSNTSEGFLGLKLLAVLHSEGARVLGRMIDAILGDVKSPGLLAFFASIESSRSKSAPLMQSLHKRLEALSHRSFLSYECPLVQNEDLERIYRTYVKSEGKNDRLAWITSKAFPLCSDEGLLNGELPVWVDSLQGETEAVFANIPRDFHILRVLRNQSREDRRATVAAAITRSAVWLRPSESSQAKSAPRVSLFLAIPQVKANDRELRQFSAQFRQEVAAQYPDLEVAGFLDPTEIVFYQEMSGIPLSSVPNLQTMRDSYMTAQSRGKSVHLSKKATNYREPGPINVAQQRAAISIRRATLLGVALCLLRHSRHGYVFLDRNARPPAIIHLGELPKMELALTNNQALCSQVITEVERYLTPFYAARDVASLQAWYAFLEYLVREITGRPSVTASVDTPDCESKSLYDLDTPDAITLYVLESEQKRISALVERSWDMMSWPEFIDDVEYTLQRVAQQHATGSDESLLSDATSERGSIEAETDQPYEIVDKTREAHESGVFDLNYWLDLGCTISGDYDTAPREPHR